MKFPQKAKWRGLSRLRLAHVVSGIRGSFICVSAIEADSGSASVMLMG